MSGHNGDQSGERALEVGERVVAAGSAAVLASVLCNPLEVVKTRMQADAATAVLCHARCPSNVMQNPAFAGYGGQGWAPLPAPRYAYDSGLAPAPARGATQMLLRMARTEGVRSLWRGLDAAVLLNLPLIAIYLPCYDYLESKCSAAGLALYGPLLSGMVARGIAVTLTSPLELLKTRVQAAKGHWAGGGGEARLAAAARSLLSEAQRAPRPFGTCQVLWRGLSVSLAKDLPFAGLYWAVLEPTRSALLANCQPSGAEPSKGQIAGVNALAGGLAASAAAALSTPLDVVKTKLQAVPRGQQPSPGLVQMLMQVRRHGGAGALFTGAGLRSVRTGAAYAILMASYEIAKTDLRELFHTPPLPIYRSPSETSNVCPSTRFHEDDIGQGL